MNKTSFLVFLWYAFLTILAAISSITIGFGELLSGLAILWMFFLAFFIGSNVNFFPCSCETLIHEDNKIKVIPLYFIVLCALTASFYAVKFYSGNNFFDVFFALSSGKSLYNKYQTFFSVQNLAVFSFAKIPAIFALLSLKFAVIYTYIYVIALGKSGKTEGFLCIFVVTFSQLYFSVSRGTSFELFELTVLLWICVSMRSTVFGRSKSLVIKYRILLVLFVLAAVSLYSYNISARYSFNEVSSCSTQELCFDTDTLLYQISIPLASLSYKLSGYFTFGLFYTSKFIEKFCVFDTFNFFSVLLPFTDIYRPDLNSDFMCGEVLDCGASWVPDVITYVLRIGFFPLIVLIFSLGSFTRHLLNLINFRKRFLELSLLYFIILAMISLPVGNFIVSSSANILCSLIVFSIFFCEKIFKAIKFKLL